MEPAETRMQRLFATAFLTILLLTAGSVHAQDTSFSIPEVVLDGIEFNVTLHPGATDSLSAAFYTVAGVNEPVAFELDDDGNLVASGVRVSGTKTQEISLLRDGETFLVKTTRSISGWWSIIPPLMAIGMALLTKRVIPALFTGIWFGAMTAIGFSIGGVFQGALDTFQVYVLQEFIDEGHASVILFSCMIGGLVGIISKNGGMILFLR